MQAQPKPLFSAVAIARALDVTTTLIQQQVPDGWNAPPERNPIVFSVRPLPLIAQSTAMTIGEFWIVRKVAPRHPTLAKVVLWVDLVATSIVVSSNTAGILEGNRNLRAAGLSRW